MPEEIITEPFHLSDKGRLGISYLKRAWSLVQLQKRGMLKDNLMLKESNYYNTMLNALGLGLEPTFQYLYQQDSSFEEFENWVAKNGYFSDKIIKIFNALLDGDITEGNHFQKEEELLDEEALSFWDKNGYVVIPNAIPKKDCEGAVNLIYDFLKAKPGIPSTWYLNHPDKKGIMVQLFNHPLLNKNRFSKKIRAAFQQLWGRTDLMVSMDRVSFNPPQTKDYPFQGPDLHWDVSLKTPIPFGLQGLLYLSDTSANQGAFTLVPGFHHEVEAWLNHLEEGVNPRDYDLHQLNTKAIDGKAGDFIIWHQALPHGSSPNTAEKPRIVQYINYQPLDREIQEEWI